LLNTGIILFYFCFCSILKGRKKERERKEKGTRKEGKRNKKGTKHWKKGTNFAARIGY